MKMLKSLLTKKENCLDHTYNEGSLTTVEDSQNKENINDSGGFIVLLKQFAFFPSLGINK